ncbi:MAG: lipid-binding protein [Bacteroidota bacterium]|nr:lipid-binding protein [Bacteroidota bacterium]
MKNIIKYILFIVLIFSMVSCETMKDYDEQYAATYPISGEWWVRYTINGKDTLALGYTKLITTNTTANVASEILAIGKTRLFNYNFKSGSDVAALTFSVTNSANTNASDAALINFPKFTVANGKVILKSAKANSGTLCDSINFEWKLDAAAVDSVNKYYANHTELLPHIHFTNPTETIVVSGIRRTGFSIDDH